MKKLLLVAGLLLGSLLGRADDGYRLWLRYELLPDARLRAAYARQLATYRLPAAASPTLAVAENCLLYTSPSPRD